MTRSPDYPRYDDGSCPPSRLGRRRDGGFYRDLLGFDLMVQLGPQAAFLSAGGYHHHLGGNTWESRGAAQAPEGTARLHRFTIVLPDEASREAARGSAAPRRKTLPGTRVARYCLSAAGSSRAWTTTSVFVGRSGRRKLAQSLFVGCDQRRLDDDDVSNSSPLASRGVTAECRPRDRPSGRPRPARRARSLRGVRHARRAARPLGTPPPGGAPARRDGPRPAAPVRYEIGGATSGAIVSSSGSASSMISRGTR